MNSLDSIIKSCAEQLEKQYGKIKKILPLDSAWNKNIRLPPILMYFEEESFVLHQKNNTSNLKRFGHLLEQKNQCETIVTSLVYIDTHFFVTKYIQGIVLDSIPQLASIKDLAQLQHKFNIYDDEPYLSFWLEQLDIAKFFLHKNNLVKQYALPKLDFQHFGLIHGDFDRKNVIHASGKNILIDIEHIMYGPIAYDLSRPLKRICNTEEKKKMYIRAYDNKIDLSNWELTNGNIAFYIIQAFNRANWGYKREASESIKNLKSELGIKNG